MSYYLVSNIAVSVIGTIKDSKLPTFVTGHFLYQCAQGAGLNVAAIEEEQEKKRKAREEKITLRVAELNAKIEVLNAQETPAA